MVDLYFGYFVPYLLSYLPYCFSIKIGTIFKIKDTVETYNDLPGTGLCCFFSLNISCKGSMGLDIALFGDSNPGLDLFKIELLEVGGGKGDCGFKRLDPPLTASSICR